jgi:putative heme iron utilization protein
MDPSIALAVRTLLKSQSIAALGTLHDGEPYVSMVPFALLPKGPDFVIHVSSLAAHTGDMLADPKVSLLVIAPGSGEVAPQARARITVQGEARQIPREAPLHPEAKESYLARFPDSAQMFALGDFSLFAIRPRLLRFVGGFAQARSMTGEGLAKALAEG